MIESYLGRLIGLSLAAFFLVHSGTGLGVVAATPWLCRAGRRLPARHAARFLLAMRWLPVAAGLFIVSVVCIPSYLSLEPDGAVEELGVVGLFAALAAIALWLMSIVRGIRILVRTRRAVEAGGGECGPLLAAVGFLRGRTVVSPLIRQALTEEQLEVALDHERAHCDAHDNLRRLALAFTPALLPGVRGFSALEREWSRFTEFAADDEAVQGDPNRALNLASALVKVARMGTLRAPLMSSLLEGDHLSERVDRLLNPGDPPPEARPAIVSAVAGLTVVAGIAALAVRPATLRSAHEFLEQLIR